MLLLVEINLQVAEPSVVEPQMQGKAGMTVSVHCIENEAVIVLGLAQPDPHQLRPLAELPPAVVDPDLRDPLDRAEVEDEPGVPVEPGVEEERRVAGGAFAVVTLVLLVPTAFVRIRPTGRRRCGLTATQARGRCRAASRRLARQ